MRIVKLTYAMLRVTNQYENDRVSFEIELDLEDVLADAIVTAKSLCAAAINDRRVLQANQRLTITEVQEQVIGEPRRARHASGGDRW